MEKRIISLLIASFLSVQSLTVFAIEPVQGDPFKEPVKIRCTCYIDDGITSSGQHTRPGIIAGKKEWEGCAVLLWSIDGDYIGIYEVLDTGSGIDTDGDGKGDSIRTGQSIDVWMPDMNAAREWISLYGDYVYMQLYEAEG